ncbi:Aldo-keto reductase yakc [Fusarium oxysporum f. sp. albedinis]|nr:Aldo-keto reductase yakc [Fusarium oxysporum f. sp. albedinis]
MIKFRLRDDSGDATLCASVMDLAEVQYVANGRQQARILLKVILLSVLFFLERLYSSVECVTLATMR